MLAITIMSTSWRETEKEGTTLHWEAVGFLLIQSEGPGLDIHNGVGRCGKTECYAFWHLSKFGRESSYSLYDKAHFNEILYPRLKITHTLHWISKAFTTALVIFVV